ncbi:MAG: DnaJ domain-containing protein [Alphaproteobacteria bacterium]
MTDILKYYQVLETTPSSTEEEIKQNYRSLAKKWHPDHSQEANAIEMFQHISIAYDVLSNPQTKLSYDVFSIAYKTEPTPDMNLLQAYKNKKNNKFLRTLSIYKKDKLTKVICSQSEAKSEVIKSLLNIKYYTHQLINKEDNLQLLLHNALAYKLENNNDMTSLYASQALFFANTEEKQTILKWLNSLNISTQQVKDWDYKSLSIYKFIPLGIILLVLLFSTSTNYVDTKELWKHFEKKKEISYFQKVEFSSGRQTVDDMDLSKVINYPINLEDDSMLYHLTKNIAIKYGPAQEFDTLIEGKSGQTIRITGLTPDEIWVRIMIDDGQMGFVKSNLVKKGIKNEIPNSSKIR